MSQTLPKQLPYNPYAALAEQGVCLYNIIFYCYLFLNY